MIDRIKQVMDYSQLSTTSFADTIGISRSGLTHLLTGRNQPSLDVARKILAKFPEISTEWLIMGMGDMIRTDNQEVQTAQPSSEAPDSDQHLAENSKMMQQADLFGEYVTQDDSEDDVVDPRHEQTEEPVAVDGAAETVLIPQPLPASTPAPIQNQVVRTRVKSAPAPNKRERTVGNVPVQEKKLQKIVFFYDDHTFEVFVS